MEYRCVAKSVEGFIRQLAVAYITHGYWFYVTGTIPEGKDPAAVDAKLIDRYGIAISKWARCRRKKRGLANMQYLRHGRFFVLLATKGRHEFFEREKAVIRDVRRKSIKFAGYSIGCRKGRDGLWHVNVRIESALFENIKSWATELAMKRDEAILSMVLRSLSTQAYAPIDGQLRSIFRAIKRSGAATSRLMLRDAAGRTSDSPVKLPHFGIGPHRSGPIAVRRARLPSRVVSKDARC